MEIIKLPAIFTSNNDLIIINQKLRNSNAKLDWSSVISITESHLEILLDGISEDDENLNLDGGIADYILDAIALYFSHRDKQLTLKDKNEVQSETLTLETIKKNKSKKKSKKIINNSQQESFLESNYIPSNNPSEKGQLFESEITIKPSLTNNNSQENIDNSIAEKIDNNFNKKQNQPEEKIDNNFNKKQDQPDKKIDNNFNKKDNNFNKKDNKQEKVAKKAILKTASSQQIRQELVEAIYKDLLGPVGGKDEEIDEMSVNDRYLVGMLAPQIRNKKPEFNSEEIPLENEAELQDELGIAGADSIEEGNNENTALPVNTMFPSSMGMSFCVKDTIKSIKIMAEWGQYERQKGEISLKEDGSAKIVWKRYPRQGSKIIELQDNKEIHWVVYPDEAPSVYVTGKIRWQDGWIVTLFLVNAQTEPAKLRDQAWLFQPKLTVTSPLISDSLILNKGIKDTGEVREKGFLKHSNYDFAEYSSSERDLPTYVKQMRGNSRYSGGTPHQLTNCPWCGTKIEAGKHIHVDPVDKGQGRTLIKCGDSLGECIFSQGEGLPVLVVDEEIYRRLPTLLIATVDKFAQLPWKGEVQMLFGKVSGYCERHGFRSPDLADSDRHNKTNKLPSAKTISHLNLRPPDLIIQDELHLISGPLGTLVGLYETAINELCTWEVNGKKVQPKIIASTATIKQAEAQIYNLFVRKLEIFPPQCLDIRDNFFSRQREINQENFGRLYLGICAPGKRLKAALIRVYIAVLASSQYLYEQYGKSVDPWMTLVGYFNSLRELGGTRRLVDDDITTRLKKMEKRGLANRLLKQVDELTSRKNSTEIPEILDRLEAPFDNELEAKNKQKRQSGQRINQPYPLDVILATNMISVGVDVKRLGMMVVCGQPKNTAEYIQATSRVGRSLPGLVITVYNWARPRDLSHYERFEHYHGTFYQNVEALSVTPFAEGALYRGLSALLISLIRQMGTEFNGNDKAGMIQRDHPYIQFALNLIVQRAEAIDGKEVAETVRRKLEAKLDSWLQRCQNLMGGATLKYQISSKDGTSINLLDIAGKKEWRDFTCLNSLRNVEPTIGLIFSDQPPDDERDRFPQSFVKDA